MLIELVLAFSFTALVGCGSTGGLILTPVENIDTVPLKVAELTEKEKKNWGHLDLATDTIPGMSVEKAYAEIIKNKKALKTQTTINIEALPKAVYFLNVIRNNQAVKTFKVLKH